MSDELTQKHCKPCEGGVLRLTPAEAQESLKQLHADWQLANDSRQLIREFKFVDFYRVMSFVNALAHIANREDHHPDLEVSYNRVAVCWSTHAIKGLSENDFICAAKTDALLA
jgi:4a-hydroxytetrahydrobiopterin dehydratase